MKFAKELERDAIPEWSDKYLNYKKGKKLIKAVAGALRSADRTPRSLRTDPSSIAPAAAAAAEAIPVPATSKTRLSNDGGRVKRYGSIVGSPPAFASRLTRATSLNLPDPALDPEEAGEPPGSSESTDPLSPSPAVLTTSRSPPGDNAYKVGKTKHPHPLWRHSSMPGRHSSIRQKGQSAARNARGLADRTKLLRRIFSKHRLTPHTTPISDIPLEARQVIYDKQNDFENFLDSELYKIETFYRERENDAKSRLDTLKDQLHRLRDQRKNDLSSYRAARANGRDHHGNAKSSGHAHERLTAIFHPVQAVKRVHYDHPSSTAKPHENSDHLVGRFADFARRRRSHVPTYSEAKRQLKAAMQEYYRGLDLLRNYAVLNRTAFRKVNKKYDKAIDAEPKMQYVTSRVNDSYFVKSEVLDDLMTTVEDLFARYFEKGNRKVAINKLKNRNPHEGDYSGSSFRDGIFLAGGLVFGIQGIVYGAELLFNEQYDDATRLETGYLFQLYGGYFIMVFLAMFFCLDLWIMDFSKINYTFIFELDGRSKLDWRQLAELPIILFGLLGLTMWLNFNRVGGEAMYIYWPVVLIGLSLVVIFFPAPIWYHKTRKWFLYTLWRLLFSGLYPVEFRDLLIGDIFCSLTYSMGNVELFFCLYAHLWNSPGQCNSSTSRLLGFFSALPGIWRALQCIRRYYDTRSPWPHLINCGKYGATILQYMLLSFWRIQKTTENKASYIALALINAFYVTFWDLLLDWSLLKPHAKHRLLRDHLGYSSQLAYYIAIILDPIIRFNWIFYVIFSYDQFQHSALLSFFVALSEAFRRGFWILFRVENNHVTNVEMRKASSDKPLPYPTQEQESPPQAPPAETGMQQSPVQSIQTRVGTILDSAHARDFERRRNVSEYDGQKDDGDDDDEDDEEEDEEGDESADTDAESAASRSPRIYK